MLVLVLLSVLFVLHVRDAHEIAGVSAFHAAVLLAIGLPAVYAREVLGEGAPSSLVDATPHTKFGAHVKEYAWGHARVPQCPLCHTARPNPDRGTLDMLNMPSPGASLDHHCPPTFKVRAKAVFSMFFKTNLIA